MRADRGWGDRSHRGKVGAGLLALAVAAAVLTAGCKRKEALSTERSSPRPLRVSQQDRFTKGFAARVRREYPNAQITIKEPLLLDVDPGNDAGISTVSLDNPFRDCHGEIDGCDMAERHLRLMAPSTAATDHGDPDTVLPVLHDLRWIAGVEETFNEAPSQEQAQNRLVTRPLVADLVVNYAFDEPERMTIISESDRRKLGLEPAALDALARKNLDAAAPGPLPDEEISPRIHQIHTGDSYEASLILLDDRWQAPARGVKGDLLVAVPSRDYVLYTGSREGGAVLKRFRALVREYEQERGHPISATVLRRTPAGWQRAFAP